MTLTQNVVNKNVANANINNLWLGDEEANTGRRFKGQMDEVRIWNTSRSAAQIRDNMAKSLQGDEPGLVAYYRMDQHVDAGQTTLYDQTPNGNDGTLTNMDPASDWVASTAFNTWIGADFAAWGTTANWSRAAAPAATDNVGIPDYSNTTGYPQGNAPTITGNPMVNHFVLATDAGSTLSSDLNVNGNLLLGADFGAGAHTVTVAGNTLSIGELSIGTGTVDCNGAYDASATTFTDAGTLSLFSAYNLGTLTKSTGTVTLDGLSAQTITGTFNPYNLTIANSVSVDASGATSLIVDNQLAVNAGTFTSASDYHHVSIASGATLELSGDITVSGNWSNDGTFTHNNHTVTFDGVAAQSVTAGGSAFDGMTINNDLSLQDALTAAGTVNLAAEKTIGTSSDVTLSGETTGTGTFNASGGTVTYGRAGDQSLYGGTYDAVSLEGSGTKTAAFALTAGTLSVPNEAVNVVLNGTGTRITNPVLFENTGTVTLGDHPADAFTFTGGISIRESGGPSAVSLQGTLTTSNDADADVVLRRTTITGNATINSGVNGIDFYDNLIINDGAILTTVSVGSSKWIYFHSTINSAVGGRGQLTLSPNFAVKFAGNVGDTTPLGTITVTSGYVEWTYPNITVENLLINGGYLGGVSPSGNMDVGNVTIASDATLKGTTGTFNVSGDWANNGTFTHNDGTVTFDSSGSSSITGSTTFNNVTCTTAGKTLKFDSTAGKTQTISNFTITGSSGNPVVIAPTTPGDAAAINVTNATVQYADVSYSHNSGNTIYAVNSTDGNNNQGWQFGSADDYIWVGRTDSDWDTASNWAYYQAPTSADDDVTISSGTNSLTIDDADRGVKNLTIDSGVTVYVDNARTLTANGTLDNNGTLSIGTGTVDANGTFDATGGNVTFTDAGNLKLGGTVNSLGTLSTANGTVWYDRVGAQTVLFDNYPGLRISGGSSSTKTLGGNLAINGNLTIDVSTTLDAGEGDDYGIILGGDWANSGTFEPREGTVTLNGTNQTLGAGIFHDLTTTGSGTQTLSGTVTVENTFTTGTGTTFALDTHTLNLGSANDGSGLWVNNGTFQKDTGTVNYAENGNQTILALDYSTLGVSGTGTTKTFADGTTSVDTAILLTDTITLTGSSADVVTVQVTNPGVTESRVFTINAPNKTVAIENMTVKGGNIRLDDTWTADHYGGGISLEAGTLNIDGISLSNSKATCGGGIAVSPWVNGFEAILTISDSIITGNEAQWGAGLYNEAERNAAAKTTILNSTISGNTADHGGGICSYNEIDKPAVVTITDSTVCGNSFSEADGGGGIYNQKAGDGSAGVYITDSIIAYNYKVDNSGYLDIKNFSGTIYGNYNIAGDWDAGWGGSGNTAYTYTSGKGEPLFAAYDTILADTIYKPVLADNGGDTGTVALAPDSIAFEAGAKAGSYDDAGTPKYAFYNGSDWVKVEDGTTTVSGVTEITTDQRGADRRETPCIGAYELYAEYRTTGDSAWENPAGWEVYNGLDTNAAILSPDAQNSTKITVRHHDMVWHLKLTIDQTTIEFRRKTAGWTHERGERHPDHCRRTGGRSDGNRRSQFCNADGQADTSHLPG